MMNPNFQCIVSLCLSKCAVLGYAALLATSVAVGCNGADEISTAVQDSSVVQLHGVLTTESDVQIAFHVIVDGQESARIDADENGDASISREMLSEGVIISVTASGHGPAYAEISSGELSDIYSFVLERLEPVDEGAADVVPTESMMDIDDLGNFTLNAMDAELEPASELSGQSFVALRYFEGPQATSLAIGPSIPLRSSKLTAVAFDGTTLKHLWTQETNLDEGSGLVVLSVDELALRFETGVWIGLIGEGEAPPEEDVAARNHNTAVTDCTTNPRVCSQNSVYIFGANLCGAGSAILTLNTSKTVTASATYMGVGVSGSATKSKGFQYNFPANTRQDAYLDVRTCNYRTCGWQYCTTSTVFSSCGSGGVIGCSLKGAGWYAISDAKKCSYERFSVHSLGC